MASEGHVTEGHLFDGGEQMCGVRERERARRCGGGVERRGRVDRTGAREESRALLVEGDRVAEAALERCVVALVGHVLRRRRHRVAPPDAGAPDEQRRDGLVQAAVAVTACARSVPLHMYSTVHVPGRAAVKCTERKSRVPQSVIP